jgi:hypothetical protein
VAEEARKAAVSAASQVRAAQLQVRLVEQEKEELEALLMRQGKGGDVASAKQAAADEQQDKMMAVIEEVRRAAEARALEVEARTKSSILKLQQELDGLAAQGVSHMRAASPRLQAGAAEARSLEQVLLERDALKAERDALKAERERVLSLPNPCGLGIKLGIAHASEAALGAAGAAGAGGHSRSERGWLVVEQLVPGMAAVNCGVIQPKDRILAIDGEVLEGHPPAQGEPSSAALARCARMLVGKRGSKVKLVILRPGGREAAGRVMDLTLKRGAWGAEHAVVEAERSDMMDLGRWPTPA